MLSVIINPMLTFKFASATCGFKKTGKPDLALIYSPDLCTYSGVFTTNQIQAACVTEDKRLLKKRKKIKAIVINSGNANACTGKKGFQAVKKTQKLTAKLLKIKPDEVLVASTGVIGVHLDMDKLQSGFISAVPRLNSQHFKKAARAILTTDKFIKVVNKKTKDFSLLGFAKGAGMLHPDMATMLCYFFTDLNMSQNLLQEALSEVINDSFNNVTVDGDVSTNDMVIVLSNNKSKHKIINRKDSVYLSFKETLKKSCYKLAKDMILDGEGAKNLINITVLGARSKKDADEIARSIASSTLFKCAVFGADPNWGRAAARVGATSVKIDPNKVDILLNKAQVLKNGNPLDFDRKKINKQIKKTRELKVTVNLKLGKKSGFALGCDLSYDYVELNSAYFT